jgi:hypothetical protein
MRVFNVTVLLLTDLFERQARMDEVITGFFPLREFMKISAIVRA